MLLPLRWTACTIIGDARVEGNAETLPLVSIVHMYHQATSRVAIRGDLTLCCRELC